MDPPRSASTDAASVQVTLASRKAQDPGTSWHYQNAELDKVLDAAQSSIRPSKRSFAADFKERRSTPWPYYICRTLPTASATTCEIWQYILTF